jgi:hypothetical protein
MCADGKDVTPGPLDYTPNPGTVLPSAPYYTMAARTAADAADAAGCSSPGPGDYDAAALQGSNWQGPAWTMAGRAADAGVCGNASPGVCGLCLVIEALDGNAPRCMALLRDAAAYTNPALWSCPTRDAASMTVNKYHGFKPLFHLAVPRADEPSAQHMVAKFWVSSTGPGEYYRPAVPGVDGPAFTLAGKLPDASAVQSSTLLPGPGHYETPSTSGGAAFTIAGRVQTATGQPDLTPGPGEY